MIVKGKDGWHPVDKTASHGVPSLTGHKVCLYFNPVILESSLAWRAAWPALTDQYLGLSDLSRTDLSAQRTFSHSKEITMIVVRSGLDLPVISDPLAVSLVEDRIEDGFSLIRTETSLPVEVAVLHDGSPKAIGEADEYGRLVKLAPAMLSLLVEALGAWEEQFDRPGETELSVPGADLVDWFVQWRMRVRGELATASCSP